MKHPKLQQVHAVQLVCFSSPPECTESPHPQTTKSQAESASTQVLRLGNPKVSLACCTPVQRKEKCFTSTCSSGYAITVVTVRSLLAVTIPACQEPLTKSDRRY